MRFVTLIICNATSITIVRNWFKKFKAGNFDLKDEDCSGRPEYESCQGHAC